MQTRDDLIREARLRGASFPAMLLVYGMLVGALLGSAWAIL